MLVARDGRLERYPGHVRLPAWLTNSIFIFRAAQNSTVLRGVNEMCPFWSSALRKTAKERRSREIYMCTPFQCDWKLPKLNLP